MPILLHCFLLGWAVVAVVWSTLVCWLMLTATKAAENHLNETLPSPASEPAAASSSQPGSSAVCKCPGFYCKSFYAAAIGMTIKAYPHGPGAGRTMAATIKLTLGNIEYIKCRLGAGELCWCLVPHCFMSPTPVNQYINDSEWARVCSDP